MIYNTGQTEIEEEVLTDIPERGDAASLVLHNDDVNTFDFVIRCLIRICKHDALQAEQCAFLVHHTGKAVVKTADVILLQPMKQALADSGLSVTIE